MPTTCAGAAGNDVYVVDNAGDIVDESLAGSNGIDTVQSSISFSLANTARVLGSVENLTLLGAGNINGTGNALNNVLTGNAGANVLNGGGRRRHHARRRGNDVYIVDNVSDIVNESLAGSNGIDTVQSSISFSLANTAHVLGAVENLTLLGSGNINGTGNALEQRDHRQCRHQRAERRGRKRHADRRRRQRLLRLQHRPQRFDATSTGSPTSTSCRTRSGSKTQ